MSVEIHKPTTKKPALPDTTETAVERNDKSSTPSLQDTHTEVGGRKGPEPTRYGDWEKNGRCIDF